MEQKKVPSFLNPEIIAKMSPKGQEILKGYEQYKPPKLSPYKVHSPVKVTTTQPS